eukprot:779555-Prymnesium_polylepis.1
MVPKEQSDGVDRLCRVEKPVYGMAQAGRRWQRTIFPWLLAWNEGGVRPAPPGCSRAVWTRASSGAGTP